MCRRSLARSTLSWAKSIDKENPSGLGRLLQCDLTLRRVTMLRHWSLVICHSSLVISICLVICHWSFAAEITKPLSPVDAQKAFVLADSSLRIELAATEPEVVDPVAIRFDE